ncbi:MAG: hypothetical protein AAFR27_02105 [Pseudomonadota bacterium]
MVVSKTVRLTAALTIAASTMFAAPTAPALADSARDQAFFNKVGGTWRGPGEIVAGKYEGTKFSCAFEGTSPSGNVGMVLDGKCRVGIFSQDMQASISRKGRNYQGQFLDGARGEGLDIVGGNVANNRAVMRLKRNHLEGAMLVRLANDNTLNVTVSVDVNGEMVPVIGMSLDRVDGKSVGSVN